MFTAFSVAQELKNNGMKFKGFYDADDSEQTDGCVQLTDKTHIQVGDHYLCLVSERNECFEYLHETESLENMIYFIRSCFMEGKI